MIDNFVSQSAVQGGSAEQNDRQRREDKNKRSYNDIYGHNQEANKQNKIRYKLTINIMGDRK